MNGTQLYWLCNILHSYKIIKMNKISYLLGVSLIMSTSLFAQNDSAKVKEAVPKNWHQLDQSTTGYYGISLDKAYDFVKLKKLKSKTVVVAVIDSGIDTLHEDLKPVLWQNPKEIPGNKIDDDKDGHIDDVHGWNFIGGKDGRNVKEDSYEAARVYNKLKAKYGSMIPDESSVKPEEKAEVEIYKKASSKIVDGIDKNEIAFIKKIMPGYLRGDSVIAKGLGKTEYNCNDLEKFTSDDVDANKTKAFLLQLCKGNGSNEISNKEIQDEFEGQLRKADAVNTPPVEYRKNIVQDDESNINDRNYGNSDIMASTPFHGTHCSGIIGAVRDNGKGVNGIADNVKIMMVRAVPDGDEHDKDIANAIRFAVDHGAQIISMSFGKDFSPEKQWVDDAVRYAESKDVLLVHAAGNDNKNIDTADNFPNPNYIDGKGRAGNWITVGASGDPKNGGIKASFSNYGKKEVDVFAPGVQIYSTIPGGNTYGTASGTSMACPVVAGTAAFLLEYYPALSAKQLKYVLETSAIQPDKEIKMEGKEGLKLIDISKTGGIINAYSAIKLASETKGDRKKTIVKTTSKAPVKKAAKK
jgi:cell wall-associated protease